MRNDHEWIFETLAQQMQGSTEAAAIAIPTIVKTWLDAGPAVFGADQRVHLNALCRQIDVFKRVAAAYDEHWKTLEPERSVDVVVASGLAAVLLANGFAGDPMEVGWRLKCANSALKLLDIFPDAPNRPALRGWAWEVLDRVRRDMATP